MYRSIGTWSWPSDPEAFEQHYWDVHVPIARSLPGLQELRSLKADESGRDSGIYRYAELGFADRRRDQRNSRRPNRREATASPTDPSTTR